MKFVRINGKKEFVCNEETRPVLKVYVFVKVNKSSK